MAVVFVHEGPTLTQERYEQTVQKISGKSRMESTSDWPVEASPCTPAGQGPNGFRVVDVWESEEAAQAFGDKLGPVLAEVGVEEEPQLYPAHTFVAS